MAGIWRRFRALAPLAQLVIVVLAAAAAASPFTSETQEHAAPTTTTTTRAPAAPAPAPAAAPTTTTTTGLPAGVPAAGDDTTVVRVVDGDTIEVAGGTRVRLIGVDTPETGQCFGSESTRYANELLPAGTRVRLVYDVQRLDPFGRTLAYVYKLTDGVFVNLALARNGFAQQATFPPNVAHAEEFRVAAAGARSASLGLWSGCAAPATTTTRAIPVTAAPTTSATIARLVPPTATPAPTAAGCHPSYSGACVPTGFSDVDCPDISGKRFRVVGPDVYRLDADKDGIACES